MPIKIPDNLPAFDTLQNENIFVMTSDRASHQDIRPLEIGILNLMPTKIETETQLLRLLSNTSLQVNIDLIKASSHTSKNTSPEHLKTFYKSFKQIKNKYYDGFIITGAPVEKLNFSDVTYWDELCEIFDWTKTHVYSTLHICWGAQAGLYYHYHIHNKIEDDKILGIFKHKALVKNHPLIKGFDDEFNIPHSRFTSISRKDIEDCRDVNLLVYSEEAGVAIISDKEDRRFFITGHLEYDRDTLKKEYFRDLEKGTPTAVPKNLQPIFSWSCTAGLLFSNWLNFCVYQQTPFDFADLKPLD